jgi:hypothetical protein
LPGLSVATGQRSALSHHSSANGICSGRSISPTENPEIETPSSLTAFSVGKMSFKSSADTVVISSRLPIVPIVAGDLIQTPPAQIDMAVRARYGARKISQVTLLVRGVFVPTAGKRTLEYRPGDAPLPVWVKNGPDALEMGCLHYPRKQTSVSYAADCDVIVCYGRAKLTDTHLASKIHCVDDEIIEWLKRRDSAKASKSTVPRCSSTPAASVLRASLRRRLPHAAQSYHAGEGAQ